MTAHTRQDVAASALGHLRTMGPAADRAMTAWACGALSASHCVDLTSYLATGDPRDLGHEYSGYHGTGLQYLFTRKGAEVENAAGVHVQVSWPEVAALVAPVLARPGIRDALHTAMRERSAYVRDHERLPWTPSKNGAAAWNSAEWHAIEDRCHDLAAEVWQACRPAAEQLDLFGEAIR